MNTLNRIMPFMERTLDMRNGGNQFFMGDQVRICNFRVILPNNIFWKRIWYNSYFSVQSGFRDLFYIAPWILVQFPPRFFAMRFVTSIIKKFPDIWALLLIVHTRNSSSLQSNLLRLQCTCCTIPTTSTRPHRSPLVWAWQWPSSQPLSSPQLSHNDSIWA